jgi:hypothetical protein
MRYENILAIKLQMGIDPSVKIAPNILLAMWQQLNLECKGKLLDRQPLVSIPNRMARTPVDV